MLTNMPCLRIILNKKAHEILSNTVLRILLNMEHLKNILNRTLPQFSLKLRSEFLLNMAVPKILTTLVTQQALHIQKLSRNSETFSTRQHFRSLPMLQPHRIILNTEVPQILYNNPP